MKVEARDAGTARRPASDHLLLDRVVAVGQDFSAGKPTSLAVIASSLTACRFERMRVVDASFGAGTEMSRYVECSFDGSRIVATSPGCVRFERCSFRNVRLQGWFCWTAEFVDCVFSGRATRMIFNGDVPDEHQTELGRARNEIRGNDFSAMDLRDVAFRGGVDLTAQVLPTGDDYLLATDGHGAIARARAEVSRWDDDQRREAGLSVLRLLSRELDRGQEHLFVRRDDYRRRRNAKVLEDVYALLAGG